VNEDMLKGFLYAEFRNHGYHDCDGFIEDMADYFDVEEIQEQDVREAVGDLIKEGYLIYYDKGNSIEATTPDHLTPEKGNESTEGDVSSD
jgi:hypothetical protein